MRSLATYTRFHYAVSNFLWTGAWNPFENNQQINLAFKLLPFFCVCVSIFYIQCQWNYTLNQHINNGDRHTI